ncbi:MULTISPECIES: S-layer family protein [unclassified Nodularia (in: cyanobacteria)]|uniref:two-partner secretion domain-containing protein n=1 Tax=unclassified Nodularia (in: cyanobacteria) TaxID=2656917 RepID=UPI00187EED63|nr:MULTISPECIES: S-layer family protein [unclassified Nodularia (in: cyanobacteria)]MBE9200503.1 S-layer family protein [Nodularia sp. LEGE 06071]MCC2691211.1 S-layer family protein [Nodularia sp. LEGE 04288]
MKVTSVCWGVACGILVGGILLPAMAQVTSDATTNTIVNSNGNNFDILNGINQGNNLFHSFSNFSIPTGGSATFDLTNTPNATTIFSRVTGGNVSNIDGLIQTLNSNNPVSLFLMNPNGIMFGQNASLNIGGSFVGTTANSIKFADGTEFSALNPTTQPLLTMSVPIGLQMGQNPGDITVQGSGHRLSGGIFTPTDRSKNPIGLQVSAGNTLALIGGEVKFSGGIAAVNGGGHLEVGSIRDGQVGLNSTMQGWVGDYSKVQEFNDIYLAEQSLLDTNGSNGSIQLQGRNINLSEGSAILIQNLGAQTSGGITVKASESLNLTGNSTDGSIASSLESDNLGAGQGGDISISVGELSMQNGAIISTRTFTQASGGNLTANVAGSINISGFVPSNPVRLSSFRTITLNSANAGNVTVSSGNLRLLNGGALSSGTIGSGQAGTVRVNAADLIEIAGNNSIILSPSLLSSATLSSGNANNTFVNTSRLVIRDGGFLGSTTVATGSAGNVIINASKSVDIQGRGAGSITPSRIVSTAEILDPATQAAFGLPAIPTGNAASLTISTPSLRITDGAFVTVRNDGPGRAGDLLLNANSIFLDNQGAITASTASGNGGDVRLNLQDYLLMRHDSLISATAAGNGNGGNLLINAPVIIGLENSDIIANAVQGRGGNINITTQGIIGLAFRNTLTPRTNLTNDITASSEFNVNGTVQINTVGVDPNSGLVELPANVSDPSQQIATGCTVNEGSSFVAIGRGGIPQNPNQQVWSDRTWSDVRNISAFQTTGNNTAQIPESSATLVQATSWHRNVHGEVELIAASSPVQLPQPSTCAVVTNKPT